MQALVDALETAITPGALWGVVAPFAGIVVVLVLFSLGRTFLRRVISGAGRGRAKI